MTLWALTPTLSLEVLATRKHEFSSRDTCQVLLVILTFMVMFLLFSEISWGCGLMDHSSNYFPFRVQQTIKSFRPTLLLQITAVHFSASAVWWVIDWICSANIRQEPREIWDGWKLNCPSLSLAGSSCHKPWRYFNLVIGTQTFSSCLKGLKWWEIPAMPDEGT